MEGRKFWSPLLPRLPRRGTPGICRRRKAAPRQISSTRFPATLRWYGAATKAAGWQRGRELQSPSADFGDLDFRVIPDHNHPSALQPVSCFPPCSRRSAHFSLANEQVANVELA